MITASIDVSKIDKTKLVKGAKGTYLDIVLIETPDGRFGDYMVKQSLSKEERAAGKQGIILGNGKIFGNKPRVESPAPEAVDGADDVPF